MYAAYNYRWWLFCRWTLRVDQNLQFYISVTSTHSVSWFVLFYSRLVGRTSEVVQLQWARLGRCRWSTQNPSKHMPNGMRLDFLRDSHFPHPFLHWIRLHSHNQNAYMPTARLLTSNTTAVRILLHFSYSHKNTEGFASTVGFCEDLCPSDFSFIVFSTNPSPYSLLTIFMRNAYCYTYQ